MYTLTTLTNNDYVGTEQGLVSALKLDFKRTSEDHHHHTLETQTDCLKRVVGRYQLDTRASEAGLTPCFDMQTGFMFTSKVYPLGRFTELAPLIMTAIEGVHQPVDVCIVDQEAIVVHPIFFGDLHGYLKQNKRLSEMQACIYFRQIIKVIDHAHKHGLVLRDLKLKKFIFTDTSNLFIALSDLEDAVFVDGTTYRGDLLNERHGCPPYVAPEMLHPGPYSGRAADMWSAGIILYTLLVGHYPFFDVNPQDLFVKIRSGHYIMPHNISYSVRSLINALLNYEPSQRPSAEAVSRHPWVAHPPSQEESPIPLKTEIDQTVPTHKLL